MLELREISIRLDKLQLRQCSLQLATGELGVLMGKTGSGKTTLLEIICGLRQPDSGAIWLHGKDVTSLSPAARQIGYVPQDLALFPAQTVRQQLQFALRLRSMDALKREQRVAELAELLEIQPLLDRLPAGLSGGEAQRVALGRALSFCPQVLVLDEPFSALDEETRERMLTLLRRVQRETGVTTLHVTHNQSEAAALGDVRFSLAEGELISSPISGN